jgi:hypothetical protein
VDEAALGVEVKFELRWRCRRRLWLQAHRKTGYEQLGRRASSWLVCELLSGDADRYLATKRASIVPANARSRGIKGMASGGQ